MARSRSASSTTTRAATDWGSAATGSSGSKDPQTAAVIDRAWLELVVERRPQLQVRTLPDEGAGRDQDPLLVAGYPDHSRRTSARHRNRPRVAAEVHGEARPAVHDDVSPVDPEHPEGRGQLPA